MSFLKKLFGGDRKSQDNIKPDIEALLSSPEKHIAIIEIDNYICRLCSFGDTLPRLTEPQQDFYFNQNLEREINNGGFNQYFFNSSGNFTHETLASLRKIGASKTADILQEAIDQFPNSLVPKDRADRQNILEQIEEKANEVWEQLDQKFYEYEDDLNDLNIEYIKKYRSSF